MSRSPRGFQLRRTAGWRMPPGGMSVARPSRWGNPYVIGSGELRWSGPSFGDVGSYNQTELAADLGLRRGLDAHEAVLLYRLALEGVISDSADDRVHPGDRVNAIEIVNALELLRGHDLGCWCPLGHPCHRSVVLEFANR